MLQAMRSGAKSPLMKFFLLFLAGGFALWGIGDGSTGLIGGSDKAISPVNRACPPARLLLNLTGHGVPISQTPQLKKLSRVDYSMK